MFAPAHHAAMKHVVPTRKELAVRTIFNFLGPLTNPAGATRQLLGVSDRRYQETIAEALAGLGCEHALVVAGEDGLDELTIHGRSRVIEVRDGGTQEWFVEAGDLGLSEAPLEAIAGGEPAENAAVARAVLARRARPGPRHLPAQRRRRRSTSAAAPTTSRAGSRRRATQSPPAPRRRCWSGCRQLTRRGDRLHPHGGCAAALARA